jgi:beta-lactamase class A
MRSRVVLALALLVQAAPLRAQDSSLSARFERRIAEVPGAVAGVYFRDLTAPDTAAAGADLRFHAASTMKVAVMVQVFRDIDDGRLSLRQRLAVTTSFRSIVGDTSYTLSMADDSDSSLYRRAGETATVRELVELMITVSSNLATNILIEQVGAARVMETLRGLGIDSMTVLRGVEDGPAYRAGRNNTTTARALGQLLAAIADGRAASPPSCGEMLKILLEQRFRRGIPAGLPRGTRVAHKTGWLTSVNHDAAIVYVRNRPRYVLVVLTRGIAATEESDRLIAGLARLAHEHVFGPERRDDDPQRPRRVIRP